MSKNLRNKHNMVTLIMCFKSPNVILISYIYFAVGNFLVLIAFIVTVIIVAMCSQIYGSDFVFLIIIWFLFGFVFPVFFFHRHVDW